jgi:ketosteroid isomerase-like protein
MKDLSLQAHPVFIAFVALMLLVSGIGVVWAADDKALIDKVRSDFNDAFNAGNARAMSRLIDGNAVWLRPGGPANVGKNTITALYSDYFKKFRSKIELKSGDIQVCNGYAFISSDFTRNDSAKAGGTVKKFSGHYLFVLKKQPDGTWKIARDIWNETTNPAGKP